MAPKPLAKVLKCRFGSRPCKDGLRCVLLNHICDGEEDCQDGSDEADCGEYLSILWFYAPRNQISCNLFFLHVTLFYTGTNSPIPVKNEYMNESPEPIKLSPPTTTPPCTSPSVMCPGSTICIKASQICDGRKNCPDGSDENCVKRCPSSCK